MSHNYDPGCPYAVPLPTQQQQQQQLEPAFSNTNFMPVPPPGFQQLHGLNNDYMAEFATRQASQATPGYAATQVSTYDRASKVLS